jgi:23S rRNA pseudouridine2605 synthase
MSSRSTGRKPESQGERIQKVLAGAGFASRREIDRLIQAGRVVVDGHAAVPGQRLTGSERVLVDGRRIRLPDASEKGGRDNQVLAYHKPTGEVTTRRDPEGRATIFDSLPRPRRGRWIAVGRLDINTSGLILLTTDGELAHRLMHPRYEIERTYAVRLRGQSLTDAQVAALTSGVQLDDGRGCFDRVTEMGSGRTNAWYEVTLHEGRNREVRRMFEAVGATVSRLMRVRFGPVNLGRMPRGSHRLLDERECDALYGAVRQEPSSP